MSYPAPRQRCKHADALDPRAFSCLSRWIWDGSAPKWLCAASRASVRACVSSLVMMASCRRTARPRASDLA